MTLPALVFGFVIALSAVVLLVSVIELLRLRYDDQPNARRRHRSRLSLRRFRTHTSESLRHRVDGPAWTVRSRVH